MEPEAPFDLNSAIQHWRDNLAQSPAFSGENLNELESHLRDSIANLQTGRLSSEEAFLIGVRRTGDVGALQAEFGKVNSQVVWLDRFLWLLLGVQFWVFIVWADGVVGQSAVFVGLRGLNYDFSVHPTGISVALAIAADLSLFAGTLVIGSWLVRRQGQSLGRRVAKLLKRPSRLALGFGAFCLVWLSAYAVIVLVRTTLLRQPPRIVTAVSISDSLASLIHIIVLLALTLFVAKKRLHAAKV
jgi:hypothetical protein